MANCVSTSPRLLLAETNSDEALFFRRMFEQVARHWQVVWEKDGKAAVRRVLNQGFPDLLVTRIDLPQRSGLDLIEWIRSLQSPKAIPVLIYDTTPNATQRQQLSGWGVEDYLDKHSPPEKVKLVLRQLVIQIEKQAVLAGKE